MTEHPVRHRRGVGNMIAPPRFIAWAVIGLVLIGVFQPFIGWRYAIMSGFDIASLMFFAMCSSLLSHEAARMRISACRNDANRAVLLLITGAVMLVILSTIFSELLQKQERHADLLALIVATLAIAWFFSNWIYALHYAHLFYREGIKGDCGGLKFPDTDEPDYWDFIYFSYCLGMTFQTSDVNIVNREFRRAVTVHCIAAFVFNLGVLAFTINVLGG
jgi:uncharacterized membrane protein